LVGCDPEARSSRVDTDTDTDTDVDTDVDTDTDRPALGVACAGTDNVLRFTCVVEVDPPQPVTLRAARADGTGVRVVEGSAPSARHALEVDFLAPATSYTVEVNAGGAVAATQLETGFPPLSVASSLVVSGTSSTPYVASNHPCSPRSAVAGVWDTATGELVWYQTLQETGSLGGFNVVQFTEDHTVLGLTGDTVVEVDRSGRDLLRVPYARDFNHDLVRRDGFTWLIYSQGGGGALLQGVSVWDASGVEVANVFLGDLPRVPAGVAGDWTHANSVFADANHQVYLSLYTQSTLLKLDGDPARPTFGQLEWVLAGGPPAGLGQDFALDWSRIDGPDTFARQHYATLRADGRLSLLDNAHGRALLLSLDEPARTGIVEEVYAAGRPICGPQGTTTETATGDVLVGCSGMDLAEYPLGSAVPAWEATLVCDNGELGVGPGNFGAARWYSLHGW